MSFLYFSLLGDNFYSGNSSFKFSFSERKKKKHYFLYFSDGA